MRQPEVFGYCPEEKQARLAGPFRDRGDDLRIQRSPAIR